MITSEQTRDRASNLEWRAIAGVPPPAAAGWGYRRKRISRASIWIGVAILCATTAALADGEFKRLSAAEIKKGLVGKVVTDGAHWSDKFKADATLESIMHGQIQQGRWRLRGNDLCMTYSGRKENAEECYQVWRRQRLIEYRKDDVTIAEGELVDK